MSDSPTRYALRVKSPQAHLFEATVTLDAPDARGQRFMLPAWIPGSYMIREFARHIVAIEARCGDAPVTIEKLDKHTWQCAPCAGPLTVTCEVYAFDTSVRGAYLDGRRGFVNGSSVFLLPLGRERVPCELTLERPAGDAFVAWRVATALPRLDAREWEFGRYRAADYDELIDHPIEMGVFEHVAFEACGVPHALVLTGKHRADVARLARDFALLCEAQIRFFHGNGKPPFERFVFLANVTADGYGGLEHRASTALTCARDDLPRVGERETSDAYAKFLGLVSHEYFHTWNVKRIKPERFVRYDLTQENYSRELWIYEGFTSYYDDLFLVRTGLITQEKYLSLMGEHLTRVFRGAGRNRQSLADASFDAWIKYYRADENAPNALTSYYVKGALIACALDLTLRAGSAGKCSLDDVMHALWQQFGARERGVPAGEVERLAQTLSGLDLRDFFARYVRGTQEPDYAAPLGALGVRLCWRAAESPLDAGGRPGRGKPPRAVLGAKVASESGLAKLAQVFDGGAAQMAGLSANDVVIALDGLRVTAGDLDAKVMSYPIGSTLTLHAFRRDELLRFNVTLQAAPADTAYFEFDAKADAQAIARRDAWLSGLSVANLQTIRKVVSLG